MVFVLNIHIFFQNSIQFVERNVNDILQYQYHSRARESRDYNLLVDNNAYVLRYVLPNTSINMYENHIPAFLLNIYFAHFIITVS